jgi:hypothetical protein
MRVCSFYKPPGAGGERGDVRRLARISHQGVSRGGADACHGSRSRPREAEV